MKFNLSLDKEQLDIINRSLIEIPFRVAAPLIADINSQIQRQFDLAKGDGPTGQEKPKDEFAGD